MNSCMGKPLPKEKQFGIKICRERKCIELQRDPKWPDSAERCMVFNSMPGAMCACVKELDADLFMRQAGFHFVGQVQNSNVPNPGVRNCPKTCPYKIFVDGEKFVWEEGKSQGVKVPAKIGTCAFTGRPFGEYGGCGCNVLGNDKQEEQIKLLETIVKVRHEIPAAELLRNCKLQPCPDGVQRCKGGTDCPVIRIPFAELKECPLWRIPAKTLPAGRAMTEKEKQAALDRVTREEFEKESLPGGVLYQEKEKESQKSTKKVLKKYSGKPAEKKPKKGPRPSLNRCPDPCPYKMTVPEDHGKEKNYPQGRCAFTGQKLREMEKCPCGVLDEMDERTREYCLKQIRDALQAHVEESFSVKLCHDHKCPDGIVHCCIGDDKQAWVCDAEEGHPPLASLHRCYLARFIPVKTEIPLGKVTQKYKEIPLSQGKVALVDAADYDQLNQFKWSARKSKPGSSDYYAVRGSPGSSNIRMHREIMKPPEKMEIDHVNGNGLDNRRENLRIVTTRQNLQNRHDDKSSLYPGVSLIPSRKKNKWQARIWDGEKSIFLGNFPTQEEASEVYKTATILLGEGKTPLGKQSSKKKPEYRQSILTEFDADIGPCKDCSIECPDDNDGCEKFQQYVEKECQEPNDPAKEARTVELSSTCLDCQALDKCKSHDPHAGCMNELAETVAPGYPTSIRGPICKSCGWPEAPTPGGRSCVTCGHHKGRRTFAETCPRKGELMFNGGEKSASTLMAETLAEGCRDAIPKPDPRCNGCERSGDCPTHNPEKQDCVAKAIKPEKKTRTRKQKEPESHDPLRKFLNEHYVEIISGENLPIVPPGLVKDMYERESKTVTTTRPMKLYLIATTHGDRFGLSPSGKISRILIPSGELHRGHGGPDCRFTFEWRFTNKAKKEV